MTEPQVHPARLIEPGALNASDPYPAFGSDDGASPTEREVETSKAISLKRIADSLEGFDLTPFGNQLLDIAYQAGLNFRGQA